MEEHKRLTDDVVAGLRALQKAQVIYDTDLWDISDPKFANLRHIQIHLSITIGKLAKLLEPQDHRSYHGQPIEELNCDELEAIVADLLIHAAQISNIRGFDLGQALTERYRRNALRFAPQSSLAHFGET